MKRILLMVGLFLLIVPVAGCAMGREVLSPGIWLMNLSNKPITNIRISWAEKNTITGVLATPQMSSQSFPLSKKADFYGDIYMTWENAVGKRFKKKLVMTRDLLPPEDINNKHIVDYVVFEFTQEGLNDYYTHHSAGAADKYKVAVRLIQKLRASAGLY